MKKSLCIAGASREAPAMMSAPIHTSSRRSRHDSAFPVPAKLRLRQGGAEAPLACQNQ